MVASRALGGAMRSRQRGGCASRSLPEPMTPSTTGLPVCTHASSGSYRSSALPRTVGDRPPDLADAQATPRRRGATLSFRSGYEVTSIGMRERGLPSNSLVRGSAVEPHASRRRREAFFVFVRADDVPLRNALRWMVGKPTESADPSWHGPCRSWTTRETSQVDKELAYARHRSHSARGPNVRAGHTRGAR